MQFFRSAFTACKGEELERKARFFAAAKNAPLLIPDFFIFLVCLIYKESAGGLHLPHGECSRIHRWKFLCFLPERLGVAHGVSAGGQGEARIS
jgi:hypothetical protein